MKKLSYIEQLRHPNWQRKRLEIMERDGFKCVCCGDAETTLNVHHKTYLKGRLAWEYDDDNFETVCEPCHAENHREKERLARVIAHYPSTCTGVIADLLVGFGREYMPSDERMETPGDWALAGGLAWVAFNLPTKDLARVHAHFMRFGPHAFLEAIRNAEVQA